MELLRQVLLFIHLLGFGALFGGALLQLRADPRTVNAAMVVGSLTQVVTGVALVGVLEGLDEPVDALKSGVKLAVAVVVAVLCWVNRAKPSVPAGLLTGLVVLTALNAAVAVFWT